MKAQLHIIIWIFVLFRGFITDANPTNPVATLTFASFATSKGDNYFESYLLFKGKTFRYVKKDNGKYVALVRVKISFRQGDSTYASGNYCVLSPETSDTLHVPDFIDVKRYWLPKGEYTMHITVYDSLTRAADRRKIDGAQTVHIGYPADTISISDAEFISSYSKTKQANIFSKCGYDLIPCIYSFYPESKNQITFYCEIYHTSKVTGLNEKFLVRYAIVSADNRVSPEGYAGMTIQQADTVNPVMAKINIADLPTGSYQLVISCIDKKNHLLTRRAFPFSRENSKVLQNVIPASFEPYMSTRDTLLESIRCLLPISKGGERDYIVSDSLFFVKTNELRNFFYNFWYSRDSLHPFDAWYKYLLDVEAVNNSFSVPGIEKGYMTDRGRVYLQYGPPAERDVSTLNPASYPYEIWQYNTLPDGQTNRKFVFYEPNSATNNYILLNSDAIGEVQNRQWQLILNGQMGMPNNVDQNNNPDPFGENILNY